MRNRILQGLALISLSAAAYSQSAVPNVATPSDSPSFALPVTAAPVAYTYDMASGRLVKSGPISDEQAGVHASSTVAYDNSCTSGFFTAITSGLEFLDWGTKSAGLTGIVDEFVIGYATREVDTSAGGPGASLEIAFFSGSNGFGVQGTEVARFAFTGLPGAASAGGIGAFAVTVSLTGGFEFCLPDGDIGYSYCSFDAAGTGPLIGDIAACPNGQDDAFDIYTCGGGAGSYVGTFFFGGTPDATWFLVLNEDDGSEIATTALNNGSGVNPLLADDGGVAPVLNSIWPLMIDNSGGQTTSAAIWSAASLASGTLLLQGGTQEVIVDPTQIAIVQVIAATGLVDHSVLVPKDTTLIGLDFTVQGLNFGGGFGYQLTNAIDVNVGF